MVKRVRSQSRHARLAAAALTALVCAHYPSATLPQEAEAAEAAPIRANAVDAHYRITWLGTHIGDFRFKSSIANQRYELRATADVSVFFGAVTWKGTTTSSGVITAAGPVPSSYSFRYRTGEKQENVEVRFQNRSVRDVSVDPPSRVSARRVPITDTHLRNVVDPLSAVILLSQTYSTRSGEQACSRRIPIFDGSCAMISSCPIRAGNPSAMMVI